MLNTKTAERSDSWLKSLESRHLANLRIPEVTRALRALSSAYVQRRHTLKRGAALDTAGKRAAFALFYGPLHFITTTEVLRASGARTPPATILDIGCGTGPAGAAWATAFPEHASRVVGIDRHPWAVEEARWTYRELGLVGQARVGDLSRPPSVSREGAIVAAFVLNELDPSARERVEQWMLRAGGEGTRLLVLEPLARRVAPWWDSFAARVTEAGGRAHEWRFTIDLPPLVRLLDRSAGLDHSELTWTITQHAHRPLTRGSEKSLAILGASVTTCSLIEAPL